MSHLHEYRQWPFLTQEEFELACALFDQKYVRAELGPTRRIFKIRHRRNATTGTSFIEILRLLSLPEDEDDLADALGKMGKDASAVSQMEIDSSHEDGDEEALRPYTPNETLAEENGLPPRYSLHSHQPYVVYEIHWHLTYNVPTLWFTLHDLPMGEPVFDLDSVYRYLVPDEYKSLLRGAGITGGLSAAPHPITDVPSFFIHPCQTKEAMETFDCPIANYLMVWLGLVGGCVGLWVPHEMSSRETGDEI